MRASKPSPAKFSAGLSSFTIVELLTAIVIISILMGLLLSVGSGMLVKAKRSRATSEIAAMSMALDAYKVDNGTLPLTNSATSYYMPNTTLLTNTASAPYSMSTYDGNGTLYRQTSQVLYNGLSGQVNFTDSASSTAKAYINFKVNQVGDKTGTATGATYVIDPWTYSYGYSTGTSTSYPYNGSGFSDLWSTGGTLATAPNTNAWINNWGQ